MIGNRKKTKYKQVTKTLSREEKSRIEFMLSCLEKNELEPVKNYFLNLLKKDKSLNGVKGAANKFSKELQLKQTPAEQRMQVLLNKLKVNFKAQRIVYYGDGKNFYILDFYVPSDKLAIEVDGEYHNSKEQQLKDRERNLILESKGIKTIRFRNEELNDFSCAEEKLRKYIKSYYLKD